MGMKTIDNDFMSETCGETVRGFMVLIPHGNKVLTLPCSGFPYYTGEVALKVMKSYMNKRQTTTAYTITNGIAEYLSLDDMDSLFGEKWLTLIKELV